MTTNRVCTFLVDLNPEDLQDPLGQFNHTKPDKTSVWELARTINDCLGEKVLDERILEQVFETYWPQFDSKFKDAIKQNPPEEEIPPRTEQDILSEILNNTRSLTHRMRDLEEEVFLKSRNLNNNIFDKNAEAKIVKMLESGKYSESEIVDSLVNYDMLDSYAKKLLEKHMFNRNYKLRKDIANK